MAIGAVLILQHLTIERLVLVVANIVLTACDNLRQEEANDAMHFNMF
jgi:hypothetical protein